MVPTSRSVILAALLGMLPMSGCGSDSSGRGGNPSGDSGGSSSTGDTASSGGDGSGTGSSTGDGSGGGSSTSDGSGGGGSACRSYVIEADMTFDGAQVVSRCVFDENEIEYTCTVDLGGETLRVVTTWGSLSAFIREAQTLGLVTSQTQVVEEPGSGPKTQTFFYDSDGRLERSEEERDEGVLTRVYSNYDAEGRPQDGEMSWQDCPDGVPFSMVYDELTNSVLTSFEPRAEDSCGREARTDTEVYGDDGDLLRVEEGGVEPRIIFESTIVDTETACE